jgi:hypothetical protein
MDRRALAVVLFVCATATVAVDPVSATENRIDIDDGTVEAEVSFELTSEEPINYWGVSLGLPDGARVESVEDGIGGIEGYEVSDGSLDFRTNTGAARESETVTVEYVVENATVGTYADGRLRVVEISLVGFGSRTANAGTTARVTADGTVLSSSYSDGFDLDVTGDAALYDGEGSTTVRVAVGDGGDYDNYAVFGDADLTEADRLHGTVPAAFGFEAAAYKHPVVVLNDTRYDGIADGWSDAQHRPSGVILLRGSAPDYTATVLHETAHAYNAKALAWSDETVAWFEEGTARYVEFLADRRRGEKRRALFAGDRLRDGSRIAPVSSVGALLDYYEGDGSIRDWNPVEDTRNRRFGYALSELVVRSYVEENGAVALRTTYDRLLSTETGANTAEGATDTVLGAMDDDPDALRPCEDPSRNATVDCLRGVNRMDAILPGYDGTGDETYPFDTSTVPEDDEDRRTDETNRTGRDEDGDGGGNGILHALQRILAGIAEFLRGLFGSTAPMRLAPV